MTVEDFRKHFKAFSDPEKFADDTIQYWIDLAGKLLNADRWNNLLDNGIELFVAHHITIEAQAQMAADAGGLPGQSRGVISSESADGVSVSYDTGNGIELDAGHWNLTVYGTRFIRLARMVGVGPIEVGATEGIAVSPAWPGPPLNWW